MTYARQRLWLGISGVGITVLVAAAAVLLDLPHRLIPPDADRQFTTALAAIALVWMLHAALLLPLDLLGGLVVVRRRPGVLRWVAAWLRGVTVQWAWYALAAALLLRSGQQFGKTGALLVFVLLQLVLLSRQAVVAWLVGGLRVAPVSPALAAAADAVGIGTAGVREIDCDDPAFSGAWSGAAAQRLWVPQQWVEQLAPAHLQAALRRRVAVRTLGLRRRGVLVAMAWNTIGFALATAMPRADLVTAPGFVTVMAWFTLWMFVGVLVLPTLSRPAVFTADRAAAPQDGADTVAATLTQLDRWQDDEDERDPRVESVFHPVPSRGARLRALAAGDAATAAVPGGGGAWHATRMMLFLGWAGIGGLSRAVHCNVGRPALWVMLPAD
ncbi:MAG: hypothetical protein IT355_19975 [Gemmatimonadaceae bacterium]|nr:hypothetical protein [Gemmatimonadaceae bacterium]